MSIVQLVQGQIQHYEWGDLNAIPQLLGREPDGRPHAELWLGTHPEGPAMLVDGRTLEAAVGPLTFLLKVLSAAKPLSLQVHPSSGDALRGFEREDRAGIPLNDPHRTYRDPFHKPEILCALTPFEAVCGIAGSDDTDSLLADLGVGAADLRRISASSGPASAIGWLLHERPKLDSLLDAAARHPDPRCGWLTKLSQQHPGDPSAAMVLLLNYVLLMPGEAIYLGAGNLHAYLGGTGVEVMASSNNVLRAGLTSKHIDTDELLRVLDATPLIDPVVDCRPTADGGRAFAIPVPDFRVTVYDIDGSVDFFADGPELLLCTGGDLVGVARGECVVATHGEHVELVGTGTVYRVGGAPWISDD